MIYLKIEMFFIAILFFVVGFYFRKIFLEKSLNSAKNEAKKILDQAKEIAETTKKEIILEGKEKAHKFRENLEREMAERRKEIQFQERRARQREELVDRKFESAENKEIASEKKLKKINEKAEEIEKIRLNQISKLEKISNLTVEQAKKYMLELLDSDLVQEKAKKISDFNQNIENKKEEIAKNVLSCAVQKYASDYVIETTVSVVNLPNDEMKGRIIGREGRNIRSIETLTGVDLIIDDTPEAIAISSFDPLRREIAKVALELLIMDGRIHPAKIEEAVKKAEEDLEKSIKKEGQRAVLETGVGEVHPDLVYLLGKLKYRTSYGQNILKHSIETAHISGFLASELRMDSLIAKRCGLLHDIGKASTYECEGSHVTIGVDILKKYSEKNIVINTAASHHDDVEPETSIAVLVQAADAISAARPGARRENFENYIKRLQKLEEIVTEFDGIEKCYAIQAGREVRVIISPDIVSDAKMVIMARDICKKIEENLSYPGQIKVNVIRENRVTEYAR